MVKWVVLVICVDVGNMVKWVVSVIQGLVIKVLVNSINFSTVTVLKTKHRLTSYYFYSFFRREF